MSKRKQADSPRGLVPFWGLIALWAGWRHGKRRESRRRGIPRGERLAEKETRRCGGQGFRAANWESSPDVGRWLFKPFSGCGRSRESRWLHQERFMWTSAPESPRNQTICNSGSARTGQRNFARAADAGGAAGRARRSARRAGATWSVPCRAQRGRCMRCTKRLQARPPRQKKSRAGGSTGSGQRARAKDLEGRSAGFQRRKRR